MRVKFSIKLLLFILIAIFVSNILFNTSVDARDNTTYLASSPYYFGDFANKVYDKFPFWYRGGLDYTVINHRDPSRTEFWESLYADVQYLYGHGTWNSFSTKNVGLIVGDGGTDIKDKKYYYGTNDVHWDADTLLVIYAACLTSEDNNPNGLASQTCERGADNVIGWRNKIWEDDQYEWGSYFAQGLVIGYGVYDSAVHAGTKSYPSEFSDGNDRKKEEGVNYDIKSPTIWNHGDPNMKLGKFRNKSIVFNTNLNAHTKSSSVFEDERNILRNSRQNVKFTSIDDMINIIKNYDSAFDEKYYTMTKSDGLETINITNGEKTKLSFINLHLNIGDFSTNAGYVITVNDGKVEGIFDNTLPLKNKEEKLSASTFTVNSDIKSKSNLYKRMAVEDVIEKLDLQNTSDYDIVNQRQSYYYNVETGKKYVRIRSTVKTDINTEDYITTLFEI